MTGMAASSASPASEFADMQGLIYTGYGTLPEACFLLMQVADPAEARAWLAAAPVTTADQRGVTTVMQIALSAGGMQALGVREDVVGAFSPEFLAGMAGDESRSRRLGDVGVNAPEAWQWGTTAPEVMVMLYARAYGLAALRREVETASFARAFKILHVLDTSDMEGREPFGFMDGVSQPHVDWHERRKPSGNAILPYGNLVAAGEFVLGYQNEYGLYTDRPLLDSSDPAASILPMAADDPSRHDLGRNGSYLVLRELRQNVPAFWSFAASQGADHAIALAETIVGRRLDGDTLEPPSAPIQGVGPAPDDVKRNQFIYEADKAGLRCPVGAHVRRANPRTGDMPNVPGSLLGKLIRLLGVFKQDVEDDLIASTRFHRLLRRGREFGTTITPQAAMQVGAPDPVCGLHFVCLNANISRQFEFTQSAWLSSPKFAGLGDEQDPLTGNRASSSEFSIPQPSGVSRRISGMPTFVTVTGGAYFFLPGVRALRYLAAAAAP